MTFALEFRGAQLTCLIDAVRQSRSGLRDQGVLGTEAVTVGQLPIHLATREYA